jgi:hypothetical protein
MAAVEVLESVAVQETSRPTLRLVTAIDRPLPLRRGAPLAERRAARIRAKSRRRRALAVLALASAVAILAVPGHVLGATTGAGLSTDLAGSSVLASGMDYVVQRGDTVSSIARDVNPVNPARARSLLVRELGSSVVVAGEHVLIP